MTVETSSGSPAKIKNTDGKTKITIAANTVKLQSKLSSYPMQLEEYQNKENENPQKDVNAIMAVQQQNHQDNNNHGFYSSEEDALYAQVNVRLEPEGESRDTEEDESEGDLINPNEPMIALEDIKDNREKRGTIYSCSRMNNENLTTECVYSLPKIMSANDIDHLNEKQHQQESTIDNPEELYAAINKAGLSRKKNFPIPEEVWEIADVKKTIHKVNKQYAVGIYIYMYAIYLSFEKLIFQKREREIKKKRIISHDSETNY